jgi:Leucine Rich repeats (2 copies)
VEENLREAERRIEEARRTQAESLDLQDLNLDDLPDTLRGLSHLRNLRLGVDILNRLKPPEWGFDTLDLSPLSSLQELKSLSIVTTPVSDLSPLASLQGLQSLSLAGCLNVDDLSPLAGLQNLQKLDLSACLDLDDLSPLANLHDLRNLDLGLCFCVLNFSPLAGLHRLQTLNLFGCRGLRELSPLVDLQALQELSLFGCGIEVLPEILLAFVGHPRLTKLIVEKAIGVPGEILSCRASDNCLPRLRTWIAELELEAAEAEKKMKALLLGSSRVGKAPHSSAHRLGEKPEIVVKPQSLGTSEKPREVFISYAWGDDTLGPSQNNCPRFNFVRRSDRVVPLAMKTVAA